MLAAVAAEYRDHKGTLPRSELMGSPAELLHIVADLYHYRARSQLAIRIRDLYQKDLSGLRGKAGKERMQRLLRDVMEATIQRLGLPADLEIDLQKGEVRL